MFDELYIAEMDFDYRPVWKKAKAKHEATLTAKKIRFMSALGPQLDALSAASAAMNSREKLGAKRQELTFDERNEQDPKKRKALQAMVLANQKYNIALYKSKLKGMFDSRKSVLQVAADYKVKLKGVGNPAEKELVTILDKIIESVEHEVVITKKLESQFKQKLAARKNQAPIK